MSQSATHRGTQLCGLLLGVMLFAGNAGAQEHVRLEHKAMPEWFMLDAEYRVRSLYINPLELGGETVDEMSWSEQRLRLDMGVRWAKKGGVYMQIDVLDGTLMGDNGQFGGDPQPSSGLALASRRPNVAGYGIGYAAGASDPLNSDNYVPVLKGMDPAEVNWAYGEAFLPLGFLRVGRQPFTMGAGIGGHDGLRRNRWGVSHYSHTADRIMFGTKIDEWVNAIQHGPGYEADPSMDNGVFLALAYDWSVQDELTATDDNLHQIMTGLLWRKRKADWFGLEWKKLTAMAFMLTKLGPSFDTQVMAFPMRLKGIVEPLSFDFEYIVYTGQTREIAEGYAALSGKEAKTQQLMAMGAHASVGLTLGPVELLAQFNFASGDEDPRPSTDWTGFSYARDFNMGLLMFEHILAFESARSAAVGLQTLADSGAAAFPLTEVATEGRFTNAVALFPQIKFQLAEGPTHWVHARLGALFAWPAAKVGVVDPIATVRGLDGESIVDDAVNYHGGKPGDYYGTEIDLQLSWTWSEVFHWTVEGAVLFPGSSMQNVHGHAVNSYFVENRFEFIF